MKCQACGQEVLLAQRCPYCGETVRPATAGEDQDGGSQHGSGDGTSDAARGARREPRATGRFVGPIGRSAGGRASAATAARAPRTWWGWVSRLWHYMRDPAVPGWKKGLIVAGCLYVALPADLVPSVLLPGLGWLDDLLVMWIGLPLLARELAAYAPSSGRQGRVRHVEGDSGDVEP